MSGFTLDAGGLIALDKHDRKVLVLLAEALRRGQRVTIPATAFAQAVRAPARQARLSRLARQPSTDLVPLDGLDATSVGVLLASSGTSDLVDAHVVVCARRARQVIVTSDPKDLARLAPGIPLVVV